MDVWYLVHVGSYEFHRLIECVSVAGTSVQDDGSYCDVGQDVRIVVDEIQGVEHGFQSLDSFLFFDGTAREFESSSAADSASARSLIRQHQMFVHWKQSTEYNVAGNADQMMSVFVLFSLRLESERQLATNAIDGH